MITLNYTMTVYRVERNVLGRTIDGRPTFWTDEVHMSDDRLGGDLDLKVSFAEEMNLGDEYDVTIVMTKRESK